MLSFRAPVVLFLKATTTKTITVPGYTRADGTFVPPHEKSVHFDPSKSAADVLSGGGSHSQKVALKKLSKLPNWHTLSDDEKHAHLLSAATSHQKKQSAAAAVSGWKAAMLAGEKPKPAQQAAFDALDQAKKDALLAEVGAQSGPSASPKDAALQDAIDHLKEDAEQGDLPAHEQAEDAALVAKLEAAVGGASDDGAGAQAAEPVAAAAEPDAPAAAGALTGKPAFDHLAQAATKGQTPEAAASAWLAANPGGHAELSEALMDLSLPDLAAEMDLPAPDDDDPTPKQIGVSFADHAKADAENEAAAAQIDALVSGTGGHYPVKAAKAITAKLQADPAFLSEWGELSHVQRLQKIVDLAKEMQSAASASAAVSGWKKAAHAGKNPSPAQWKAFYALPAGKKAEMLSAVHAAAGGTDHLKAPAVAKDEPVAEADDGPKDGDTKTGANGATLVFKNGRWHKVVAADEHGEVPPVLVPADDELSGHAKTIVDDVAKTGNKAVLQQIIDTAEPAMAAYAAEKLAEMNGVGEPDVPSGGQAPGATDPAGADADGGDQGAQTTDLAGKEAEWDVFHNTEPGHNKFWAVSVVGESMITHYGKIGAAGTTTVKHFKSYGAALAAASKLQIQKQAKGYAHKGVFQYPIPEGAKSAPKPAGATVKQKPSVESADGWQQTGGQQGSNPGGRFRDPAGHEWYIKTPASEAHAKNELLAAKLYAAAGIKVPDLKLVMKDGKVGIASKWQDGLSKAGHPDELAMADGALSGFAVDAWLANWDVTGLGLDNMLVGPDGKAVRIDVGGSLLFRAQGEPKGGAFGDDVAELQSLLDPKTNGLSAALFGGMSKAAMQKSAERVLKISDQQITGLVQQFGPGTAAERAALAQKLIARKASLAKAFPKAKGGKKAPVFKADDLSEPPNFLNWGGSGQGGPSSKSWINEANHAASQAIWAAAKTGKPDAVTELTAPVLDKETGAVLKHVPVLDHPSQWVRGFAQQMLNEIDHQMNPPKVFRFEGGHPVKELDEAYPVAKVGAGAAVKKLGEFIVLGDPGTVTLTAEQTPPKITHQSGSLTRQTYSKAAQAAIAKLPETQRQAIKAYTGSSYSKMNKSLWSGNPAEEAKAAAAGLHAVGHEVAPGTVLSRKINMHGQDMEDLKKAAGKVLQEPAIMSTSIRPSCWSGNVHFKLNVGPGVKGLYAGIGSLPGGGALSKNPGEDEIILPPNTRLLVQSVKKSPSGGDVDGFGNGPDWVVEVLVLPTSGETL